MPLTSSPQQRLRIAVTDLVGRPPLGLWSAPGRVNLIGEHTDYNGGLALPIALPRRTYAAASPRRDARLRVWSRHAPGVVEVDLADIEPGRDLGWATYVAGVLWVMRREGIDVPGLDLVIDSDVPVGAGLSSSAALECAALVTAAAVAGVDLLGDERSRTLAAAWAQRAENEVVGAPTGGMDQLAAMLGCADNALLLDLRAASVEHVPCTFAGHELLVIDTRAEHRHADGAYAARRRQCEAAAEVLGVETLREVDPTRLDESLELLRAGADATVAERARHVVTEIARVERAAEALRHNDLRLLGDLFIASHASLRDNFEVSCPELDVAVEAALAHGAVGARMTGGGFGGSAIALVPTAAGDEVTEGVRAAYADKGWSDPLVFTATASEGARRDA